MASNQRLCEIFQDFHKDLGDFIRQTDLMEVNFEHDLDLDFFRQDIVAMKDLIARMREELETICEELK